MEGCPVEESYAKVPRSPACGLSSSLWNTYSTEKHRIVAEKKQAREGLWKQRSEQIGKGRSDYAARRRAVKIDTLLNRHQKRAVYSQLYEHNKLRVKSERSSVNDRPNGATHVRPNGATFRVLFGPSNWVIF